MDGSISARFLLFKKFDGMNIHHQLVFLQMDEKLVKGMAYQPLAISPR